MSESEYCLNLFCYDLPCLRHRTGIKRGLRVAVIGGGPAGLSCARRLLEEDCLPTIFERREDVGGMWRYSDDPTALTACYKSLVTNTPKRLTAFEGFPLSESLPTFPSHIDILAYLENLTRRCGLRPYVHTGVSVTAITYEEVTGTWKVSLSGRVSEKLRATIWQGFDGVAVCVGHHWEGKVPVFPGQSQFLGKQLHSSSYRISESFANQRVLIVGMGVSGGEIAKDLLRHASQVHCSTARGDSARPPGLDGVIWHPKVARFEERTVFFVDSSFVEVDAVIYCTGYQIRLPPGVPQPSEHGVLSLYKRVIDPHRPSLGFIGFVTTYGSLLPIQDAQARFFVRSLTNAIQLPSQTEMLREIEDWRLPLTDTMYRAMNVDYWSYIGEMYRALQLPSGTSKTLHANRMVKVASVQGFSSLGTVEENRLRFAELCREAARNGAKIIVLPEAAITGYASQDLTETWHVKGRKLSNVPGQHVPFVGRDPLEFAEAVPGPSTDLFCCVAKEIGAYITVPLLEKVIRPTPSKQTHASFFPPNPYLFYNSCVLVSPSGQIVACYRKNNLWGCVDNGWCTAGSEMAVYETEYGKVGLCICFDVHVMFDRYHDQGLWALLYPIAWVDNDAETWFTIDLPQRIAKHNYHVVGANWSIDSSQTNPRWLGYGYSAVYEGGTGRILSAASTRVGCEIVYADLPSQTPCPTSSLVSSYFSSSPSSSSASSFSSSSSSSAPSSSSDDDDVSSDLLNPTNDPPWTRRSKPHHVRFSQACEVKFNDITLHFEQGGDAEHMGMTLWDSSIVLGSYLAHLQRQGVFDLKGKTVLELGSGVGALGIMCANLGAHVVLTDLASDTLLLDLLTRNVHSNMSAWQHGSARVAPLSWGTEKQQMQTTLGLHQFDVIVASDVVYDNSLVAPLLSTLVNASCPETEIFLAFESHKMGPLESFFASAKQMFAIDHIPFAQLHPDYRCGGISIKRLRLFESKPQSDRDPFFNSSSSIKETRSPCSDTVAAILSTHLRNRPPIKALIDKHILAGESL